MKTQDIITAIYADFANVYKSAGPFVNSGQLWDFCMSTIRDATKLQCIIFANDLGIPPVRSLLLMYQQKYNPADGFTFTMQESQWMGALMGFLFTSVLGYQVKIGRVTVNALGVRTATRFANPASFVEIK